MPANRPSGSPSGRLVDLAKMTPREAELYAFYRKGLTPKQIAERLGLARQTVATMLSVAKEKARSQ